MSIDGDVTVLVDAELLTDDRLLGRNGDLAGEGSVADALAGAVGDLDRLEDVLERSSTVDRIGRRRIMTELGLEVVDELRTGSAEPRSMPRRAGLRR